MSTIIPESSELEAMIEESYRALSLVRGYMVNPGDSVCVFIAPLLRTKLDHLGVVTVLDPVILSDGSSHLRLKLNDEFLDAAWLALIPHSLQPGLPSTITYHSPESAVDLNREPIPTLISDLYFNQINWH